ncbi:MULTISPECIES: TIR domain-containing protein [Streptomyces]|uniref:TIR domain-containing protein n=1 Tax=Streptomyces flavovirens TaxID=52258 RepID=A0ABV8MYM8_9ACTN|nr:TIR domain-containing protein [Streptomyces sp. MBT51]
MPVYELSCRQGAGGQIMERDGFISYSHRRDMELAQALQRGLHTLARPWTRRPVLSVFRDTTSLSANHDLWSSILTELERSRYFIYLASPEAAASRWVRKEIEFWLANRALDRFLIAVSDGTVAWDVENNDFDWERTDALPPVLRGRFATEPLWVDLVKVREQRLLSLRQADFRDAVATLAAPLHGRTKDELDSRDIRERQVAKRLRRTAVGALAVLLVTSLAAGVVAWQQRGEALYRARVSASQALAAHSLELADSDPRKAAQFALYAEQVESTGESAQALARAVEANSGVVRHVKGGFEKLADFHGQSQVAQTHVAVSRDGGIFAHYSDLEEGDVHLYDIRTGRDLPDLPTGMIGRNSEPLLLSRDGRTLALEAAFNRIEIWDVRKTVKVRTITASRGEDLAQAWKGLRSFTLSADGRRVAASYYASDEPSATPRLGVWDTRTGKSLLQEAAPAKDAVYSLQDDGTHLLAVDTEARTTRLLDLRTGTWARARTVSGLPAVDAPAVSFSGDPRRAWIASDGKQRRGGLWDFVTGKRVTESADGPTGVTALPADNPDLVVGAEGNSLVLYDGALRRTRTLGAFTWGVLGVSVSGDGRWVAAGSADGAVSLYSTRAVHGGTPLPHPDPVDDVRFTPDGRLAYRTGEKTTQLWKVGEGDTGLTRLGRIPRPVDVQDGAIALSPDATRIALLDVGRLTFWDPRTGAEAAEPAYTSRSTDGPGLFYLPGGRYVVGTWWQGITVIDTHSGEATQTLTGDGSYLSLAQSGDRGTLASVDEAVGDIGVWRWSAKENRFEHVRDAHAAGTSTMQLAVSVSHGGEKVATVDRDSRITIVDVRTGRTVSSAVGPGQGGHPLVFSRDTRLLVQPYGAGERGGLDLWDTATGDALGSWDLSGQGVPATDLSVDIVEAPGGGLLTRGQDGSLVRRALGGAEWRATLCALVADPLPDADRDRYLSDLDVDAPCDA